MRGIKAFASTFILVSLVACAPPSLLICQPGEQLATLNALYFGTATAGNPVAMAEWEKFLEQAVTPRFPQGLTWWQGAGQWQTDNKKLLREQTYILHLVYPRTKQNEHAIQAIITEYKEKFSQEAVLRAQSHVCISY